MSKNQKIKNPKSKKNNLIKMSKFISIFLFFLLTNFVILEKTCNHSCIETYRRGGFDYIVNGTKLGCACSMSCCASDEHDCDILCLQEGNLPMIYDYECGLVANKSCSGNWSSTCCSMQGKCGNGLEYCGIGCQPRYGKNCYNCKNIPVYDFNRQRLLYFKKICVAN